MQNEPRVDPAGLIRVEAASYSEALRRIGERFGKDVSIVHTRVVRRKGVLGALGATGVEIYVTGKADYQAWRSASDDGVEREAPRRPPTPPEPAPERPPQPGGLERMLQEVQGQVRELVRRRQSGGPYAGHHAEPVPPQHPVLEESRRILEEADFSPEFRTDVMKRLSRRRLPGTSGEPAEVRTLARVQLGELLRPKIPPCIPIRLDLGAGPRVVAVVGPTGVGKTTTIAKLASPLSLIEKRRVGLVTLDTYRIGAVDQLKRFADIIQLPIEVVAPGESARGAIERFRDCDVVFIDTAGRSQNDAHRLAEMHDMLDGIGGLEIHLCLSMTASRKTNLEVLRKFRVIHYDRILITKLDESPGQGALLDVFHAAKTPVSYITCGQEVPDDIRAASVDRLESLLLGD